jgi:hypothetical protein
MKRISISIVCVIVVLALAAPKVRAYVTAKALSASGEIVQTKWRPGAFPIPWKLNPAQGANVTGARTQADVLRSSFSAWQSLSAALITFTEGSVTATTVKPAFDGTNLVSTNISAADYGSNALGLTLVYSFDEGGADFVDSLGRPVEFAGQISEADILFNPSAPFSTDTTTPSNKVDFQSVATHEIGHLLGLDHSTLVSATMFPTIANGYNYARVLSSDDIAAVSTIYPSPSFATKGKISGTVRTTAGAALYGAIVVAVNSSGTAVAGTISSPNGTYTIEGLDAGAYTIYAEPMDGPFTVSSVLTLGRIYPASTTSSSFTTRYH